MAIKCCKNCVPPTRYPGCHGTCQRYLEEKAQWEKDKVKIRQDMPMAIYPGDFDMLACVHRQRKDNRRH